MYYTYVLHSEKDGKFYTGYTGDLKQRFEQHSTKVWWIQRETDDHWLICYEACIFREDALRRERVLKSYQGKMFIRNRLKSYLAG